jgi:bifunctional enzyme CysN/CysC
MDEKPCTTATTYILKQTTRSVKTTIVGIVYRIDVDTLHRSHADVLLLNDIGRVELSLASHIFYDPYRINRATGCFILIDPLTNNTVAAGMIRGVAGSSGETARECPATEPAVAKSSNTVWSGWNIPRETREKRNGHKAAVLWLTGYSGAGKSTIAKLLEERLFAAKCGTMLLDGDNIRHGLCGDLGFSERDRKENIRRAGEVARLFFEAGHVVICAFISPFIRDRRFVRSLFPEGSFFEVHVKCDLETCIQRDPHGIYKKALAGEIADFTGISSPYEEPEAPEMVAETDLHGADRIVDLLVQRLMKGKIIREDFLETIHE